MDPDAIATQFVQSYYTVFDSDRSQIAAFYVSFVSCMYLRIFLLLKTNQSILSFEGTKFHGTQAIGEKLKV